MIRHLLNIAISAPLFLLAGCASTENHPVCKSPRAATGVLWQWLVRDFNARHARINATTDWTPMPNLDHEYTWPTEVHTWEVKTIPKFGLTCIRHRRDLTVECWGFGGENTGKLGISRDCL